MSNEQLKLLIAEGEGLTVEFKEKFTAAMDRDMVAFANTRGGMIFLGVSDDGRITGEKLTNRLKADIVSLARNCDPHVTLGKIVQNGNIVVVEVPHGDETPYSCASGYYRRLDAVTQKMSRKEIQVLFQKISPMSFEEKINKDVSWADISKDKIRAFFEEGKINYGKIDVRNVLSSLNLSRGDEIKNAGVMFFAADPRRAVLQCQMTLVAFKGTDRVHIYDRKDIQDDLLTQYKEAIIFLEKHLNVRTEIKGVNREDIYEIPFAALREGVANAIIHRDYSVRGTSIMVEVHADRVVISNPGGLPDGWTSESLLNTSVRRNELIADMFARMDKVERIGSGMRRMRDAVKASGLPYPKIESNTFFFITFRRPVFENNLVKEGESKRLVERLVGRLADSQRKIMEMMGANPYISKREMAEMIGISTTAVDKNIQVLKKKRLIKREGSAKAGRWRVCK